MTYSTKQLVERALDLANCANTDFLSHKELTQYINDAYNNCYQISINRGDDNFVKTLEIHNGTVILPKDFYSLRSVKGKNGYLFKRKTFDTPDFAPGYEIINNKINITGLTTGVDVTYYPLPKYLTIQENERPIEIEANDASEDYKVSDANNQYFIYYKKVEEIIKSDDPDQDDTLEITHYIYIKDMLNNTISENIVENEIDAIYTSNTDTFWTKQNDKYILYDIELNKRKEIDIENNILVRNKNGSINIASRDENKITIKGLEHDLETKDDSKILDLIVLGNYSIFYYDEDFNLYVKDFINEDTVLIDEKLDNKITIRYKNIDNEDGLLYVTDKGPNIYSLGFDLGNSSDVKQVIDCDYENIIAFTDKSVIYNDNSMTLKAIGNIPNVMMNVPNSAYYSLIAYTIATYLIAKQQGDVTLIQAQREKALADYYDCQQDDYNVVRIKNIYT